MSAAPLAARAPVRVLPGGHHVSRGGEILVTVLGSCVSACIRDPVARIGGMNHFMLPQSGDGAWGAASASMRFGNFAMERLINEILSGGGRRTNLEIKLFGGASMLDQAGPDQAGRVGRRNVAFAEEYLAAEGLPIAAADLLGDHARRIEYDPMTGRVRMLAMPYEGGEIVRVERGYVASLQAEPAAGSIELFD